MKKKEICVALVVFGLFLNYNNGYAQKSSSQPPQRPTGQVSFGNKSTTKTINQVGESHFASKPQTTTKSPSFFEKVKSTFGFDEESKTKKELKTVEKKLESAEKKGKPTLDLQSQKDRLLQTQKMRTLEKKEQIEGNLSFKEKMDLQRLQGSHWANKSTQLGIKFIDQKGNISAQDQKLLEETRKQRIKAAQGEMQTIKKAEKEGTISPLEAQAGKSQALLMIHKASADDPILKKLRTKEEQERADKETKRLENSAQLGERRLEIENLQKNKKLEQIPLKMKQIQDLELDEKISTYLNKNKLTQNDLYNKGVLATHTYLKDIMEEQIKVRSEIKDIEQGKSAVKPIEEVQERNESQPKKNKDIFTESKEKPAQEKVEISEKTTKEWQKATPSSEAIIKSIKFIDTDAKIGTGRATDTEKSKTSSQEISTQKTKIEQKTELQENESDQEIKQGMSTKKKVAIGAAIGVGAAAIAGAAAGIAVAATQENSSSQTPPQPTAPAPDSETPATDSSSTDTAASDTPNTEPTF